MNQQISKILSKVGSGVLETVARGVLDDASASLIGEPQFEEITTSHNDLRTIGIVKASGNAMSSGVRRTWSVVAKIIDSTRADDDTRGDVTLDNEQSVYELHLFADDGVPLRPAKYFLTQYVEDDCRILWLEDLTDAPQPPWNLEHFVTAADHLGQFAGYHLANHTQVPFELQQNWYLARYPPDQIIEGAQSLLKERESNSVRTAYRNVPVDSASELAQLYNAIQRVGQRSPHCLSYGDSHSRNMFPLDKSTVGIDWGFIGIEPIGADVGVLIGSALTYTLAEAHMIAANERRIFDSYIAGLRASGWAGDESPIRIGFFCQFGGYLSGVSTIPVVLRDYLHRRDFIEGRFGVPFEDVPAHVAPVIELIPRYVEELKGLLGEAD